MPSPNRVIRPTALAVVAWTLAGAAQALPPSYTLTEFATAGAPAGFTATAFTRSGVVLGTATTAVNGQLVRLTHAYDPVAGTWTVLPTASASNFLLASGSNAAGQAGGSVVTTQPSTNAALRNADGTLVDLGGITVDPTTVNTGCLQNVASAVNDAGQVLVNSSTSCVATFGSASITSVTGGPLRPIGSLVGGSAFTMTDGTIGHGLNAAGVVVGAALVDPARSNYHAFVSGPAGLLDLNLVTSTPATVGGTCRIRDIAYAVNDAGLAVGRHVVSVGRSALPGQPCGEHAMHAAVWNTVTHTYSDLTPDANGELFDINNAGDMVGISNGAPGLGNAVGGATVLRGKGVVGNLAVGLKPLNSLVNGLPPGWSVSKATRISAGGAILAQATDAQLRTRSVLLMPSAAPAPAQPVAPSNLAAAAASDSQINLTWTDNGSTEQAFVVSRCAGLGCTNFATVATLPANTTSYASVGLAPATSYSYQVTATNGAGEARGTNTATAVTPPITTPPKAPTGLQALGGSVLNSAILDWVDNATNEASYTIERCRGRSCTNFAVVGTVGANTRRFVDQSQMVANTRYSYRVRASNVIGNSAYSNVISVSFAY